MLAISVMGGLGFRGWWGVRGFLSSLFVGLDYVYWIHSGNFWILGLDSVGLELGVLGSVQDRSRLLF